MRLFGEESAMAQVLEDSLCWKKRIKSRETAGLQDNHVCVWSTEGNGHQEWIESNMGAEAEESS